MKKLIKKKIHFNPEHYEILKTVSDTTGVGFSLLIGELIEEHLTDYSLEDNEDL